MRTLTVGFLAASSLVAACGSNATKSTVADTTAKDLSVEQRFTRDELTSLNAGREIVTEYINYTNENVDTAFFDQLSGGWFDGARDMPTYTSGVTFMKLLDVSSDESGTARLVAAMENVATMATAKDANGKALYNFARALDASGNPVAYGSLPVDDGTVTEQIEERVISAKIPKAMTGEFKILSRMASRKGVIVSSNYTQTTPAGIAMNPGNLRNYIEFYPYNGKWLVYGVSAVNLKIMAGSESPASLASKLKSVLEAYRAAASE